MAAVGKPTAAIIFQWKKIPASVSERKTNVSVSEGRLIKNDQSEKRDVRRENGVLLPGVCLNVRIVIRWAVIGRRA